MTNIIQNFVSGLMLFCVAVHAFGFGGECPSNVQTVQNFNPNAYLGLWYEYAKYPYIFEFLGKCITAEYGLLQNGDVSVFNRQINQLTNRQQTIEGSAKINGPGKLLVTFPSVPSFVGPANYWVIDTDYRNYAVVWSCTIVLGAIRSEVAWILTRERHPNQAIIATAKQALLRNGLSVDRLQKTDQNNC